MQPFLFLLSLPCDVEWKGRFEVCVCVVLDLVQGAFMDNSRVTVGTERKRRNRQEVSEKPHSDITRPPSLHQHHQHQQQTPPTLLSTRCLIGRFSVSSSSWSGPEMWGCVPPLCVCSCISHTVCVHAHACKTGRIRFGMLQSAGFTTVKAEHVKHMQARARTPTPGSGDFMYGMYGEKHDIMQRYLKILQVVDLQCPIIYSGLLDKKE